VTTTRLVAREVPWADEDAVRLRREMWEYFRPLFPEETARAEERLGGFAGADAHVGRAIVTTLVILDRSSVPGGSGSDDDGGTAVGCGSLRPVPRLGPTVGEIKKVYVTETARGRGVARALLVELERKAVELGWDRLVLETNASNSAAIALYGSHGYEHVGDLRAASWPAGTVVTMAKSLGAAKASGRDGSAT